MRKTLTAAALMLALCCPAFAGIMHGPVKSESEPPPQTTQEATREGDMNCPLVEIVLSLLALF